MDFASACVGCALGMFALLLMNRLLYGAWTTEGCQLVYSCRELSKYGVGLLPVPELDSLINLRRAAQTYLDLQPTIWLEIDLPSQQAILKAEENLRKELRPF